ncbi:MAG TPA: cation diffusion facilitator family transporter [Candidatus Cybelea sp.]|nr:cation diffusion facilitator family transporter [Candidatus Cybelea sp.]
MSGIATEVSRPSDVGPLMRQATYASTVVACVLICAKTYAWVGTDSVAMLSSLVDSLLDVVASLLNLFAVRHALQPADREHRFGHGKAESLAGLAQAAFIAGSAAFLLLEAATRLLHPQNVSQSRIGIAVMLGSIVLTAALVAFQRYVVRRSQSVAIGADLLHYVSDLMTNLAVIVALVLSAGYGWWWADPVLAGAIGLYILFGAWRIFREAFDHLMDREFPDDERDRIRAIVLRHTKVRALHDLRTRSSGVRSFLQMHLELDGDISLSEAHRISDEVEEALLAAFPGAEIIVHQDPAGLEESRPRFATS